MADPPPHELSPVENMLLISDQIILIGGPWDGHRFDVPAGMLRVVMPEPAPEPTLDDMRAKAAAWMAGEQPADIMPRTMLYERTGHIRDDGTREFELRG